MNNCGVNCLRRIGNPLITTPQGYVELPHQGGSHERGGFAGLEPTSSAQCAHWAPSPSWGRRGGGLYLYISTRRFCHSESGFGSRNRGWRFIFLGFLLTANGGLVVSSGRYPLYEVERLSNGLFSEGQGSFHAEKMLFFVNFTGKSAIHSCNMRR